MHVLHLSEPYVAYSCCRYPCLNQCVSKSRKKSDIKNIAYDACLSCDIITSKSLALSHAFVRRFENWQIVIIVS